MEIKKRVYGGEILFSQKTMLRVCLIVFPPKKMFLEKRKEIEIKPDMESDQQNPPRLP